MANLTGSIDLQGVNYTVGKEYPAHDAEGNVIGTCVVDANGNLFATVDDEYFNDSNIKPISFSIEGTLKDDW